jgi:hypothetical protein
VGLKLSEIGWAVAATKSQTDSNYSQTGFGFTTAGIANSGPRQMNIRTRPRQPSTRLQMANEEVFWLVACGSGGMASMELEDLWRLYCKVVCGRRVNPG